MGRHGFVADVKGKSASWNLGFTVVMKMSERRGWPIDLSRRPAVILSLTPRPHLHSCSSMTTVSN